MKTIFQDNVLIKLIKNSASMIQGIDKVHIELEKVPKSDIMVFDVEVWFSNKIFTLKSTAYELQKVIFFNLSQQLDTSKIKINIYIRS